MAWTTKSSLPHSCSTSREDRIERGRVGDVAVADDFRADLGGQRLDPLLQLVALIGQRQLGAGRRQALAMPQAIEWLLATPRIRPRLPAINPSESAISAVSAVVGGAPMALAPDALQASVSGHRNAGAENISGAGVLLEPWTPALRPGNPQCDNRELISMKRFILGLAAATLSPAPPTRWTPPDMRTARSARSWSTTRA